jgi:hypothetical protein
VLRETDPENESEDEEDEVDLVPIQIKQDWSDRAVVIVDEAQLISDSLFQSDLVQFGTGKLLTDLFTFLDLKKNSRKLIFVGDPNQLSFGDQEISAIKPDFLEGLADVGVAKVQIISENPGDKRTRLAQNLQLATGISSNRFNKLQFVESDEVHFIQPENVYELIKQWLSTSLKFVVLTYSNEEADAVNKKIRSLLNRPADVDEGDLLVVHNTVRVLNADPLSKPRFLSNGAFIVILKDLGTREELVHRKKKGTVKLIFRDLVVRSLDDPFEFKISVFENFRLSEKARLSPDDAVAFRIIINRRTRAELKKLSFESSFEFSQLTTTNEWKLLHDRLNEFNKDLTPKTVVAEIEREIKKLVGTARRDFKEKFRREFIKNDAIAQSAFVRFGWSMTVHRAMGQHWPSVVVNTQMGNQARKSLMYFQWLYSAISRSTQAVYLLNHKNHTPLSETVFDQNPAAKVGQTMPKPKGRAGFEMIESNKEFADTHFPNLKFTAVINYAFSAVSYLESKGFKVSEINTKSQWLVKLIGKEPNGSIFSIVFNYDKKGIPGALRPEKPNPSRAIQDFLKSLEKGVEEIDFPSQFREEISHQWKDALKQNGWVLLAINSFEWVDRYWLSKNDQWCIFDAVFNIDEFVSHINVHKLNDSEIWHQIVPVLKGIYDEQT